MAFNIEYVYQITDKYSAKLKKIVANTNKAGNAISKVSEKMKKTGYKMTSLRNIISASYGAAAVALPIKLAADFEEQMINVRRIVDFKSEDSFKKFREGIEKTAVHLGKMPSDIGKVAYEAAKQTGSEKGLLGAVKLAAEAGIAFDLDSLFAGEAIGRLKARFGLVNDEARLFLDSINYLGDRNATTGQRIMKTIGYGMSAFAGLKGVPKEFVAGWATVSSILVETPRKAATAFKILTEDMQGNRWKNKFAKGPHKAIMELLDFLNRKSAKSRIRYLDKHFSKPAARLLKLATENTDQVNRVFNQVKSGKGAGSLVDELNKKLKGTNTALDRMKSVAAIVGIAIGDIVNPTIKQAQPALTDLAWNIRDWIVIHPKITKWIVGIVAGFAALMLFIVAFGLISIAVGALIAPVGAIFGFLFGIPGLIILIIGGFIYLANKAGLFKNTIKSVLFFIKEIKKWWDKIDFTKFSFFNKLPKWVQNMFTGSSQIVTLERPKDGWPGEKQQSVSSSSTVSKAFIDLIIKATTEKGTEIVDYNSDSSASMNLGFYMGDY